MAKPCSHPVVKEPVIFEKHQFTVSRDVFALLLTYLRLDSDLSHSRTKPQTSAVNEGTESGAKSHKILILYLVATPQKPFPAIAKFHIKQRKKYTFVYCQKRMVRSPTQAGYLRRLWEEVGFPRAVFALCSFEGF